MGVGWLSKIKGTGNFLLDLAAPKPSYWYAASSLFSWLSGCMVGGILLEVLKLHVAGTHFNNESNMREVCVACAQRTPS